jgi:hypothetical protein
MKNDNGFIYDEDSFSEEDQRVLHRIKKGLENEQAIDPVTGRKQKKMNLLNKRKLSKEEMDEFFLDY